MGHLSLHSFLCNWYRVNKESAERLISNNNLSFWQASLTPGLLVANSRSASFSASVALRWLMAY